MTKCEGMDDNDTRGQFMFMCRVGIVSKHVYKVIEANPNLINSIKWIKSIDYNTLILCGVHVGFASRVKKLSTLNDTIKTRSK